MSENVFSIGLSGLTAARLALATTSHNIANASTPGYSRQTTIQTASIPQQTGAGFIGAGVTVTSVTRLYNQFLETQRLAAQTQQSYLETHQAQLTQVDNMLADPTTGLSPALQGFFSGLADVAANPSSVPSRQSMLSSAESLVSRFQALDTRMNQLRQGVGDQVETTVERINTLAQSIADVNNEIIANRSNVNQPANDLFDHRSQLVTELNKLVRVQTVEQSDGSFNVFIGSGQNLVVGGSVLRLDTSASPEDPGNTDIALHFANVTVPLDPTIFQGGELGGLLSFRDGILTQAQNAFGRVAMALASTFNDQHKLGQDLNGALGTDFFTTPVPVVQTNTANTGDAVLSATLSDISALTTSDYRVVYAGGNYTVTRVADSTVSTYTSLPQTFDGITLDQVSGTLADGDAFYIQPTRYGARDINVAIHDTALVAAAAPIRTAAAVGNNGNAKISAGTVTSTTDLPLATDVVLTYAQATNEFVVSGASPAVGNIAYSSGTDIAFNGLTFKISGSPADGDTFRISRNSSGVADNRNALLLGALQTTAILDGQSASYQSSFSQLVSAVGNSAAEIKTQLEAQNTLVQQTTEAEQAFSGVNLDDEAAHLIRNQQAYQAAAKVLQIASSLFQSVLEIS